MDKKDKKIILNDSALDNVTGGADHAETAAKHYFCTKCGGGFSGEKPPTICPSCKKPTIFKGPLTFHL